MPRYTLILYACHFLIGVSHKREDPLPVTNFPMLWKTQPTMLSLTPWLIQLSHSEITRKGILTTVFWGIHVVVITRWGVFRLSPSDMAWEHVIFLFFLLMMMSTDYLMFILRNSFRCELLYPLPYYFLIEEKDAYSNIMLICFHKNVRKSNYLCQATKDKNKKGRGWRGN